MSSAESGGNESGSGPPQSAQPLVAETELAAGALKLPGVMVQAVTHIAPGLNVLLGLTFIVGFAGVTAPISYVIGGLICLGVAVVLTQLAKHITSAGGYFTYVSKTVGARAGWLTTWTYFLYDPVAVAAVCAFTSALLRDTLKAQYGWSINWYILFFVIVDHRHGLHHVRRGAVGAGDARARRPRGAASSSPSASPASSRRGRAASTSRRSTRATSRAREGCTWGWCSPSWPCRGSNRSPRWRRRPRTRAATCRSRSSARPSSSPSSTSSSTGASWSASARRAWWAATSRRRTRSSTSPGGCGGARGCWCCSRP